MQVYVAEETISGPNDQPSKVEFPVTNGDTIEAKMKDPYGFWFLGLKSGGPLPDVFSGAYTSRSEALRAINTYLDSRRLEVGESTRPVIQYKPGYGPEGKKKEK